MKKHLTATQKPSRKQIKPAQLILLSFLAMILIGTLLLRLPIASRAGDVGLVDTLFTATSATCVTGLVVVETATQWTLFGKVVILALIQFGGLGLVTILTILMVQLHRRISLRSRLVIQASFNQEDVGGMVLLVHRIVRYTAAIELVGALLFMAGLYASTDLTLWQSFYHGIFLSVSSFCNAGFDILGSDSLVAFQSNPYILSLVMVLIVLGSIGFVVLAELVDMNKQRGAWRIKAKRLSVHTKIVLSMTGILIFTGAALFFAMEYANPQTLGPMSAGDKALNSVFQSVSLRTAGFSTLEHASMNDATKFFFSIFMMVGGSPTGTAGGMKTVTVGIVIFSMISVFKGKGRVEAFGRTLPMDLLQKALTIMAAMLGIIWVATLALYFIEADNAFAHTFVDLLYEATSATGTVGSTSGITPQLSVAGKIVLMVCMYIGRLGPVTVVVALNARLHNNPDALRYPDERVIMG